MKADAMENYRIKNKILIDPEIYYAAISMNLTASEWKILLRCLQKRKWEKTKVNGKKRIVYTNDGFIFPYDEGRALGVKNTSFYKAIRRLIVDFGFLDLLHQGGWFQKHEKVKDYSIYKLSDRWKSYGTPDFVKGDKQRVLQSAFYVRQNIARKTKPTSENRKCSLQKTEDDKHTTAKYRLQKSEAIKKVSEWDKVLNPLR